MDKGSIKVKLKNTKAGVDDRLHAAIDQAERRRSDSPAIEAAFGVIEANRRTAASLLAGGLAYRLFLWALPFALFSAASFRLIADAAERSNSELAKEFGMGAAMAGTVGKAAGETGRSYVVLLLIGLVLMLVASKSVWKSLCISSELAWGMRSAGRQDILPAERPSSLRPTLVVAGDVARAKPRERGDVRALQGDHRHGPSRRDPDGRRHRRGFHMGGQGPTAPGWSSFDALHPRRDRVRSRDDAPQAYHRRLPGGTIGEGRRPLWSLGHRRGLHGVPVSDGTISDDVVDRQRRMASLLTRLINRTLHLSRADRYRLSSSRDARFLLHATRRVHDASSGQVVVPRESFVIDQHPAESGPQRDA